ncbi:hypothetical protein KOR42_31390 [Thalassoglobus neptunius]|uniref:Uncharacterized protein n=1 Tax=Thalassoglobus neptunius TaxID=1938619 RepID=A0A5C5WQH5_9PLAN|nr:hypothetical protein KOR42_31390 [Thalassoglobus neptunius]
MEEEPQLCDSPISNELRNSQEEIGVHRQHKAVFILGKKGFSVGIQGVMRDPSRTLCQFSGS